MNRHQLVARLAGFPSKVHSVIAPLTEGQLAWRPADGGWSIKEVLCHLRDGEEVRAERMRRVVYEQEPLLSAFDQEAYARDRGYQDELTPLVLPRLVEYRTAQVELLRSVSPEAWARKGTHEESGPITLEDLATGALNHDREHLEQIRRLRDQAGVVASRE